MSMSVEDQLWENACQLVRSALTDIITTQIGALETELDGEKLNNKIYEYLKKANKTSGASLTAWQAMVEDFVHKFYASLYHGLSDRIWLERADFSLVCAISIKAWKPEVINAVPQDDYMHQVGTVCALAHDHTRWYSHAWETFKKVIDSKVAQKRTRDAVDKAREEAVKTQPANIDAFLPQWIESSIKELAKESPQKNPRTSLTEEKAVELFNKLIQDGAGIPLWLESCKPPPNSPDVQNAVVLAYTTFPEPRAPGEYKGKGKGKGKDKDGGGASMQGYEMGMNMFAQMMGQMMGGGGGWGGGWGGDGGGKGGWGPY